MWNKSNNILMGDEISVIEISNEKLSHPYNKYFDILWKKGKNVKINT